MSWTKPKNYFSLTLENLLRLQIRL